MKNKKIIYLATLTLLLNGCNGFFDKDNTPTPAALVNFTQTIRTQSLWHASTGYGIGSDYIKLGPAVTSCAVFTANKDGTVTANNKLDGKRIWSVNTHVPISSGPAAFDNVVIIGSREGDVVALRQSDGTPLWKKKVSSEVLAKSAGRQGLALIKTIDGKLSALSTDDGSEQWHYQQTEPTLILRGASTPQIARQNAVVGFANGNLVKLSLDDGNVHWEEPIANAEGCFAIQRMIDVDADPIIFDNRIYAATYQGRISALEWNSGKSIWTHDISSYTGLTVDNSRVYVSDAKSHLWAFNADTGALEWCQSQLEARNITGPVIMGDYLVVGDEQGYLHWLSKRDGHFIARVRMGSGILATPVVDNGILYVVSRDGQLAAYTYTC